MPVDVKFPDGSIRSVPSHKVEVKSKAIGGAPSTFIETPDPHLAWRFKAHVGGWRAIARY